MISYVHKKIAVYCYRPKRSFGQGNVFIGVCHSVNGGGEYLTRYPPGPGRYTPRDQAGTPPWDQAGTPPWDQAGTPGRYTPPGTRQVHPPDQAGTPPQTRQVHPPWDQAGTPPRTRQVTPPGPGRYTPQDQAGTPLRTRQVHPPQKQQTPEYGQRSAGMHPTGMHSCNKMLSQQGYLS